MSARTVLKHMAWILAAGLAMAPGTAGAHVDVQLKDANGNAIAPDSVAPYSPRQTCGACHSYEEITLGYHFQQGWDELYTEAEKEHTPWLQGPGMAGKW